MRLIWVLLFVGTLAFAGSLARAMPLLPLAPGAVSSGGALSVDAEGKPSIDPALADDEEEKPLAYATGAKLYNLPDVEGRAGEKVVPEVAAGFPQLSNGGKTLTITLKPGWQLSDGTTITAENFAHELERVRVMGAPRARALLGDLRSAQAVGDLKLQLRLRQRRPDFPALLSSAYFAAVPTNLPMNEVTTPFPSGGPYYVAAWDTARGGTLKRNTFYTGTRPHNVDQIVYNIGIALDAQRLRAERGDTDVAGFPPAQAAELRDKYGVNKGRFFVKGQAVFWYLNFNHDHALFKGNGAVERAINWAIDRPAMVRQHGALGGARTDQILPIDFPGFRNWNIYSLRGADVAKARHDAAGRLGGKGGKVAMKTFSVFAVPAGFTQSTNDVFVHGIPRDAKNIGPPTFTVAGTGAAAPEHPFAGQSWTVSVIGFQPDGSYKIRVTMTGPGIGKPNEHSVRWTVHVPYGGSGSTHKVQLWIPDSAIGLSVAEVVQQDLRLIGLDTDITPLDRVVQTTKAGTRGAAYDLLLNGWGEDYPDPYDFINLLLSGTSIQPANNVNLSYFNSPTWNARMAAAAAKAGPARFRAYSILDRDLMKGPAPVAPYMNTNARILVSGRVENYTFHEVYGTDFAALSLK